MEVLHKAYGKCTLEQLLYHGEERPQGHGISSTEQQLMNAFRGISNNEFNFGTGLQCNFAGEIKKQVGEICFTHQELFIRFSRLDEHTQGSFLQSIFIELYRSESEEVDVIEIDVPWGKNNVRTIRVEKIPYNSLRGPTTRLQFSLI